MPPLYLACMLLCVAVVVDAHEEDVVGVFSHFVGVVAFLYLVYCLLSRMTVFQLHDDGGLTDVLTWHEHQVGETIS